MRLLLFVIGMTALWVPESVLSQSADESPGTADLGFLIGTWRMTDEGFDITSPGSPARQRESVKDNGLILAGLLVLVRLAVGRDWVAWWALGVFTVVAGLRWMNRFDPGFGDPAAQATLALVIMAVLGAIVSVEVFRRFGVLAFVVTGAVHGILVSAPVTLDPTRWYFWRGGWAVALVFAFAIWGFVCVLGRQSLLPDEVLDG